MSYGYNCLPKNILAKGQLQEAVLVVSCQKVLTEEEDADENGWIAVILWIIQQHCRVPSETTNAFSFAATVPFAL